MINVGAGVIDADYRGSIKVLLFNHSGNSFTVQKGDRIAQLIIKKLHPSPSLRWILLTALFMEMLVLDQLDPLSSSWKTRLEEGVM